MRKGTRDAGWALLVLITASGYATREPVGGGVVADPDYHDGYWGDDGAFWHADAGRNGHRDEGHHFQHMASNCFAYIHGSGALASNA